MPRLKVEIELDYDLGKAGNINALVRAIGRGLGAGTTSKRKLPKIHFANGTLPAIFEVVVVSADGYVDRQQVEDAQVAEDGFVARRAVLTFLPGS